MARNRREFSTLQMWIISTALIMIVLSMVVYIVAANDGRVNSNEHLGGAVVYCVDDEQRSGILIVQYAPEANRELLFVSAERIDSVGDNPLVNTQLGSASAPYGDLTLWRLSSGEFQINGVDEHGKPFVFIWRGCGTSLFIPYSSDNGDASNNDNPEEELIEIGFPTETPPMPTEGPPPP